jgi:phosphate transport system substrate-binding protein
MGNGTFVRRTAAVAVVVAFALAGCTKNGEDSAGGAGAGAPGAAISGDLPIGGSSTAVPLADALAREFEKKHPGVDYSMEISTSSMGMGNARFGQVKVGLLTGDMPDGITDLAVHTVARDGLAVIVHSSNTVSSISDEQLVAMYLGKISNWSEVGGPDEAIRLVHASDTRSALQLFLKHFELQRGEIKDDTYQGSDDQAVNTVVQDSKSVAYLSIANAHAAVAAGKPIKIFGLGGIEPTAENVANGSYPLTFDLNMVLKGDGGDVEKAYLEFARSDEGKEIAKKLGYAPVD